MSLLASPSVAIVLLILTACNQPAEKTAAPIKPTKGETRILSPAFKAYWYDGKAEITSYQLKQARYGEIREGKAVLVFVTEPFRPDTQVKADRPDANSISVLKLNSTKDFITGIYPYHILTSTFFPLRAGDHALKVSAGVQEWCGQVYTQLNNRGQFQIKLHSYFEGEADREISLPPAHLENEIWTKIRINPQTLPVGDLRVIPALEYLRLLHKEINPYTATASLVQNQDYTYTLHYPELNRTLVIRFAVNFPYEILGWTETYPDGLSPNASLLTSQAEKITTLKTAYWKKNALIDVSLRDSLGL